MTKEASAADDFSQVSGSKVLLLPNGVSPCNSVVAQMITEIRPKIVELVEAANLLKMWVTFLIPRIEDGNNFGVSVQVRCDRRDLLRRYIYYLPISLSLPPAHHMLITSVPFHHRTFVTNRKIRWAKFGKWNRMDVRISTPFLPTI